MLFETPKISVRIKVEDHNGKIHWYDETAIMMLKNSEKKWKQKRFSTAMLQRQFAAALQRQQPELGPSSTGKY